MESTSVSLLHRLKQTDQADAWARFVDLYAPLIYIWGSRQGLNDADASDLVQEVMAVLVVEMPKFEYDPQRRFRGWLRTVTRNKAIDLQRRKASRPINGGQEAIEQFADPRQGDLFEEAEYRGYLVDRMLTIIKSEFPEYHFRAFEALVLEGRSGAEVASELGISENAVYVAKSRIAKKLRGELEGLLE